MGVGLGGGRKPPLSPHFGLSKLPVVALPPIPFEAREKVPGVAAFANDRPAAWVDDTVTPEARDWARTRRAPTLLLEVNSAIGLTRAAVDELLGWADAISRPARPSSRLN